MNVLVRNVLSHGCFLVDFVCFSSHNASESVEMCSEAPLHTMPSATRNHAAAAQGAAKNAQQPKPAPFPP